MNAPSSTPAPGGRRVLEPMTGRRWRPMVVTGLVAMLVTVLALALQAPAAEQGIPPEDAPDRRPLAVADAACPSAESDEVTVASDSDDEGTGELTLRTGADEPTTTDLGAGDAARDTAPGDPVVVRGEGALAPGLFAARYAGARGAGECVAPSGERWFVGAGSSGLHASVLELTNPDSGPAVADLDVWGVDGPLEEVRSSGLTVPGRSTTRLDLSDLAPSRAELALRVTVTRGRLASSVSDSYALPGKKPALDWLAASAAPTTSAVLPGLSRKADERTLVLANPGEAGGRVDVRITGTDSSFAPAGLEAIEVPAGEVVVTDLTETLLAPAGQEDVALTLESTVPVVASLRNVVGGDVVHLPAVPAVTGRSGAAVSETGEQVLLLTTTLDRGGAVTARFLGDVPEKEARWRGRLKPGTTTAVPAPDGAVAVVVDGVPSYAGGVRVRTTTGATFLPLRSLVYDQILPKVTPALPDE